MEVEIEERDEWKKTGDPRFRAEVEADESVRCGDCGREIEDGEYTQFSAVDEKIYHERCDLPRSDSDGEQLVSRYVEVVYVEAVDEVKSLQELKDEIEAKFKKYGLYEETEQVQNQIEAEAERLFQEQDGVDLDD